MTVGKLLVANRGEISVRVIRTCRELGIRSVAVYSEADERAMHRRLADEAYAIGPAPAPESYLNIERLVEAIERSGAAAVHPGYGFLSESAAFARAVREAGAVWVGPPPEAMEAMGFKVRAKEIARRADVPTVPGYDGSDDSEERLAEEAERIGYPVLVKASAGGGGRGMRAVTNPKEFAEAVRGARREAEAAFGDGSVFLEKLLEDPRHVEVQIIGDDHGNVVHLYERECSIQRRHQKVVEEAPSPALSPELRETICDAAVRLAREAGYSNAGTVEFLLDGEDFYFLEMNARLQVEHPVTEMVAGLDLVRLQLAVAAGDALPFRQEDVTLRGSAIEARIYAEDDAGMPVGGKLLDLILPQGAGVRNDTGFDVGDEVPINYDSMLAKLIVHAPDRSAAVRRLRRALDDYSVLGVPTNLPLLDRIAGHPAFAAGETTTGFLDQHALADPAQKDIPRTALLIGAAADLSRSATSGDAFTLGPWRMMGALQIRYDVCGDTRAVEAARAGPRTLKLTVTEETSTLEVLHVTDGRIRALVDGESAEAEFAADRSGLTLSFGGETYRLARPAPPDVDEAGPGGDSAGAGLTAPMPGTIVKIVASEGDEVEEGQLLLVLEAMKMEQPVTAPHAGTVTSLPYGEGSLVPGGAVLAEIERPESE
ncbi:MAG TPA: biotin carboxylase N-terminal domain-containing protein [Rubrobacteraceae bacterium]|nr:biotin carboxylase N-terminal domain-containing protein [Rubrobacteraceae bacterium]